MQKRHNSIANALELYLLCIKLLMCCWWFQIPEFDNLYLDFNGVVHVCSHPEDNNPHFRITEEKIFQDIFHYIEVEFCCISHWGEDKMAAILQATFSDAFSWMKIVVFWFKFNWNLFRGVLSITSHHCLTGNKPLSELLMAYFLI